MRRKKFTGWKISDFITTTCPRARVSGAQTSAARKDMSLPLDKKTIWWNNDGTQKKHILASADTSKPRLMMKDIIVRWGEFQPSWGKNIKRYRKKAQMCKDITGFYFHA